jgi:hypothetical protein
VLLVGLALAVSVVAAGCGQSKAHEVSVAERDRTMAKLDRIAHMARQTSAAGSPISGCVPDIRSRCLAEAVTMPQTRT